MSLRFAVRRGACRAPSFRAPSLPRPNPNRPPIIHWPTVAAAGGVAAFLMLCLVALIAGRMQNERDRVTRQIPAAMLEPPAVEAPNAAPSEVVQAPVGPAPEALPVSFQKPAASPPLPEGMEEAVLDGLPASERPVAGREPRGELHGTAVAFARSPAEAARQALDERKLLFTLHLSGNFEEPGFT
jgi:hypothetical protein